MSSYSKASTSSKTNTSISGVINTNPDFTTIKCKRIGNYILAKTIGKGTFSKVKLASHIPTQQKVAIKILDKTKIKDDKDVQRIIREIKILKTLRHRNIAQLYETLSSDRHIYIVMEYIEGGDLFEYIFGKTRLDEKNTSILFQQLISVIEYIHKLGIAHRDIKPENILLNATHTEIKIVDFGLSNNYEHGNFLATACGSPCYAPPEMILGNKYDGLTSDIWSCGVVLYYMVVGQLPFDHKAIKVLYKNIIAGKYDVPPYLSKQCTHFLSRLLKTDPKKRMTLSEIHTHPFITNHAVFDLDSGTIIGYHDIEVDYNLVKEIKSLYCPNDEHITKENIISCVKGNNYNDITTMYYLALNQKKKQTKTKILEFPMKIERRKCDLFNINNIKKLNFNTQKDKEPDPFHAIKNTKDPKGMNFVVINNYVSENNQKKNVNVKMNMVNNKGNITLTTGNHNNTKNNNNLHMISRNNQTEGNHNNNPLSTFIQTFCSHNDNNSNSNITNKTETKNILTSQIKTFDIKHYISKSIGSRTNAISNSKKPTNNIQLNYNTTKTNQSNDSKVEQKGKLKVLSKSLQSKVDHNKSDSKNIVYNTNSGNNNSNKKQIPLYTESNKTSGNNTFFKKKINHKTVEISKLKDDFRKIMSKVHPRAHSKPEQKQSSSPSPNRTIITQNNFYRNCENNNEQIPNLNLTLNKQINMKEIFNDEQSFNDCSISLNSKRKNHPNPIPKQPLSFLNQTTTKKRTNLHTVNKDNNNWLLNTTITYDRSLSKQKNPETKEEFETLNSYQKIIQEWEECKKKQDFFKPKRYQYHLNTEMNNVTDHSI